MVSAWLCNIWDHGYHAEYWKVLVPDSGITYAQLEDASINDMKSRGEDVM